METAPMTLIFKTMEKILHVPVHSFYVENFKRQDQPFINIYSTP